MVKNSQTKVECQLRVDQAELMRGIGKLDQSGTALASGIAPIRNPHEGIQKNASEIIFALDSFQTEYFSNPCSPGEFLIDISSSLGARMIWEKLLTMRTERRRAVNLIERRA